MKLDLESYIDIERQILIDNISKKELDNKIKEYEESEIDFPVKESKILDKKVQVIDYERLFFPFEFYNLYLLRDVIEFEINKLQDKSKHSNTIVVKSSITQIELIELVKALKENGSIQGTQKDLIESFANFLGVKINNINQNINKIKNRNNGSEALFIDRLKASLMAFINE